MSKDLKILDEIKKYADSAGVTIEYKGFLSPGKVTHIQIKGALLVNYYPFSEKKTAYVAGTTAGRKSATPKEAVAMALNPPPVTGTGKRKSMTKIKHKMLEKKDFCHWCKIKLTSETATVDHVIPLSRGGLDNANNRVLSCQPCNQERGNSMPEVRK